LLDDLILNPNQYGNLLRGTVVTLQVIAGSFALGTVMALLMGVARLSSTRWVRGAALVYIEFARGVAAIILLFWMAYALPILVGLPSMPALLAGILALGLNMGAYGAEIVRGAIQAVPKGQYEASVALNLSSSDRLRHVILPQAVPIILPPYGNLTIEVLKGTALVSLIGLSDLAFESQLLRTGRVRSSDPVNLPFLYLNVLVIYLILSQLIAYSFRVAERRSARKFGST
jgi:polar amino acid transport system permease protein